MEDVCRMCGVCVEDVWRICGRCVEDVWRMFLRLHVGVYRRPVEEVNVGDQMALKT